jgi:hypothetical protein
MHRPLNDEERRLNAPVVTTCNEQRREVSVAQNIANKQIDRTFLFDKVATALPYSTALFFNLLCYAACTITLLTLYER